MAEEKNSRCTLSVDRQNMTREQEEVFLFGDRRTLLTSKYPFNVFRYRELPTFEFGSEAV